MKKSGKFGLIPPQIPWHGPMETHMLMGEQLLCNVDWFNNALPSDTQVLNTCVADATCGWIECMLREANGREIIPVGLQLNFTAVWEYAIREWHDNDRESGLILDEAFKAAVAIGLLPRDTVIRQVDPTYSSRNKALRTTPLVQGHKVYESWMAHQGSGVMHITYGILKGYHATLEVAQSIGSSTTTLANSWGSEWGMRGYGVMSEYDWEKSYCGYGPYTAECDLKGWRGHEQFLILQ